MFFRLRRCSHWPAKLLDQRARPSDRRACAAPAARARPGVSQLSLRCASCSSSSSGMLLHRKNDSREASSRSLTRYGVRAASVGGSCSTRKTNLGSRACAAARAGCRCRRCPCCGLVVELEQRLEVAVVDRPPVRAPRQRREDAARTRLLVRGRRRLADEDPAAARRVAWRRGVERPVTVTSRREAARSSRRCRRCCEGKAAAGSCLRRRSCG